MTPNLWWKAASVLLLVLAAGIVRADDGCCCKDGKCKAATSAKTAASCCDKCGTACACSTKDGASCCESCGCAKKDGKCGDGCACGKKAGCSCVTKAKVSCACGDGNAACCPGCCKQAGAHGQQVIFLPAPPVPGPGLAEVVADVLMQYLSGPWTPPAPAYGPGPIYAAPPAVMQAPLLPPAVSVYDAPRSCPVPPPPATAAVPPTLGPTPLAVPAQACSSVAEPAGPGLAKSVFRVCEGEKAARLEIQSAGSQMLCENVVLKIAGSSFKVCAAGKQVRLEGPFVKATADTLTPTGQEDRVLLEGHVHVQYSKDGQEAEITAARVIVGLADGSVEIKPAPVNRAATTPPAPPMDPATFNAFNGIGFFR